MLQCGKNLQKPADHGTLPGMARIRFISADGSQEAIADSKPGDRLLDVAQAHGMPLEGTCEGAMACSTCHVYIDPAWVGRLPKKESMEEDMLDFAWNPDATTSRLTCQIKVTAEMDGLRVQMPEKQI